MEEKVTMDTEKLIQALRWREDVASGEMITCKNYQKDYMGYDEVSQNTLDYICKFANLWWNFIGSPLRITNNMGEIIPATRR